MAGSLNKVELIGNLGADPEIRNLNSNQSVANFTVATSESWTKDGEKHERTEWHRVVCWNDGLIGVIEKYLKKGSKVFIQGQLQTRKWEDSDGKDRYSTEVVLQGFDGKLIMLGEPGGNGGGDRRDDRGRDDRRDDRGSSSRSSGRNEYADRNGKEESRGRGNTGSQDPDDRPRGARRFYGDDRRGKGGGRPNHGIDDDIPFAPEFR